jgi:hypothetical protein
MTDSIHGVASRLGSSADALAPLGALIRIESLPAVPTYCRFPMYTCETGTEPTKLHG